jgi:pimeloyl-ACP methyl ester carboxylesterase
LNTVLVLLSALCAVYLLITSLLYFMQRRLLFYPVPAIEGVDGESIFFSNQGITLEGWVLNQGQPGALIYFGGNSEDITANIPQFDELLSNYAVYLINYRGYGRSSGSPSEAGLFSDALAIYDQLQSQHSSISLMGRSLGSGVAVYLASVRKIDHLFLLTPFDSITKVAHTHYPYFPTRYLIKDRFESTTYAASVNAPVTIVTAGHDEIIPVQHTENLRDHFTASEVSFCLIGGAAHNDITDFPEYRKVLRQFADSNN